MRIVRFVDSPHQAHAQNGFYAVFANVFRESFLAAHCTLRLSIVEGRTRIRGTMHG